MAGPNYLIGFGERLVRPISLKTGGGPKRFPYTFEEARTRLLPEWQRAARRIASLPDLACPSDKTVISVMLHPAFLARSYYPSNFLRDLDLHAIGSRARALPTKRNPRSRGSAKPQPAPELFVAGKRTNLSAFVRRLPEWSPGAATQDDFSKIEQVNALDLSRLKSIVVGDDDRDDLPLEVVLHAREGDDDILEGFQAYAEDLGAEVNLDARLHTGGLCFLPMRAPAEILDNLTTFSFVRIIRRMPRLSLNESILRTVSVPGSFRAELPSASPVNADVRVAVFDGGLPQTNNPVAPWARAREADGVGPATAELQAHGLAVTSALLFGPLERDREAPIPYSKVDHWRVLDRNLRDDDFELVAVLRRIMNVLRQRKYDFVCLSVGPDLSIVDDDVHIWTSTLDAYLARGDTVLVSACGNTGAEDWESGNARIQPCADAVNAIGVGAATTRAARWARAPYSSIGPGRSPGFVKPDVVAFGGSEQEPFWLLDQRREGFATGRMGTSYAAPNALRAGVGIKAHFGAQLSAAAIKALMVHHSSRGDISQREVGWGRMPRDLGELVVCRDGEATVVYAGILEPSQFIRFPIPVPRDPLTTAVTIKATFCFFTPVDPEDSLNYTRAGLGIAFRPSTRGEPGRYKDGKLRGAHPTATFFRGEGYYSSEIERRRDAHKWETVLRAQDEFNPGTLHQPVFDVEHHARLHGGPAGRRTDIPYALIVSISSESEPNLYNRILAAYPNQLEILQPTIEVPITVRR